MKLVDFLKEQEGFSPVWYKDGTCWAIGYGHHSCAPNHSFKITKAEATLLLLDDILAASHSADKDFSRMTGYPTGSLPRALYDALTELCFSTGSLRKWPKFVAAVVARDYAGMARESRRYYRKDGTGEWVYMKRRSEAFIKAFLEPPVNTHPKGIDTGSLALIGIPFALAGIRKRLIERKGNRG